MGTNVSRDETIPASTDTIPREPLKEKFDVPEEIEGYPPAHRPATSRKDIYKPEDNRQIYVHALKAPKNTDNSWDDLVHYLTSIYRTDIKKVRSIYSWLGAQNIGTENVLFVSASDDIEQITPRGYKKLIKQRKCSYASMFAILCRKAGIRCVIINGISKGYGYAVGMKDVTHLRDRWNAVYIDGWRLIHPLWAFKALNISKQGHWEPQHDQIELTDLEECPEIITHDFNDYFFLVEPTEFVDVCLPDNPKWQLCSPAMTLSKWTEMPLFLKMYYMEGFKVPNQFTGELKAHKSTYGFVIWEPDNAMGTYQMAYTLSFNHNSFASKFDEKIFLKHYVLMSRESYKKRWSFEIRMPVAGMYRITVYGGLSTNTSLPWICDIGVVCEKPSKRVKPYPVSPSVGFGPVSMTAKAGLLDPSHKAGMLFVKSNQTVHITFSLVKSVLTKAKLVSKDKRKRLTKKWVSSTVNTIPEGQILDIVVRLEEEGEYALKIYVSPKDTDEEKWKNVCNYFMSTDKCRPNGILVEDKGYRTAMEVDGDRALDEAKKGRDLYELKSVVQQLNTKGHHESDGSFGKASMKMEYLELVKALKEAISLQNVETLTSVIKKVEVSEYSPKLATLLEQARHEHDKALQAELTKLVSESEPTAMISDVVKVALTLLGEDPEAFKTWDDVSACFLHIGASEVLQRMRDFDVSGTSESVMLQVRNTIDGIDENVIRTDSKATAMLYTMVKRLLEKHPEQSNTEEELQI